MRLATPTTALVLLMLAPLAEPAPAAAAAPAAGTAARATKRAPVTGRPHSFAERWQGVMVREGAKLDVTFTFASVRDSLRGTFSAPALHALDIPLHALQMRDSHVRFELVGDATTTVFEGTVRGDSLTGTTREGETRGTFQLRRAPVRQLPYRTSDVRFKDGDLLLAGTLYLPLSGGNNPGVVFLHGSGPETRDASRFMADTFARRGIASLVYDKRGAGASAGDWRASTFDDLAADAIAAVRVLQGQPGVDPHLVGIVGHSQGASIAPLIASRAADVSYVISVSGFAGPVYQQDIFQMTNALRDHGFSDAEITRAMVDYGMFLSVARTGEGWARLDSLRTADGGQKWFQAIGIPPRDNWLWKFYRGVGSYDALTYWRQVKVPALLVSGEDDRVVPSDQSLRAIARTLDAAGNHQHMDVLIPRAGHDLTIQPAPGEPFDWPRLAPGYTDLLVAWIHERAREAREGGNR